MKEAFRIKIERVLDDLTADELANVIKSYHEKDVYDAGHNIKIEEHYDKEGNFTDRYCVTLYDVIRHEEACNTIPSALLILRVYEDLKDIPVETRGQLCNQCANKQCVMQSGIYRNDCEFFITKESEENENEN